MKKILALVLSLMLVMSVLAIGYAANDGSVTVNNAIPGETYKLYKVFDLTYATAETSSGTEGGDTLKSGVSYTYTKTGESDELYTALTDTNSPFTLSATSTANVYSVTLKSGKGASDISDYLKTIETKLAHITDDQVAPAAEEGETTSSVHWDNLAYGYYYVTSSVGATVTIDSTLKDVVVKDKNSIPGQDKKQQVGTSAPAASGNYQDGDVTVQVGDKVWYQIEVTDGKGTNLDLYITDTMTAGLTFDNNITVYKSIKDTAQTNVWGAEQQVNEGDTTWRTETKGEDDTWTFKIDFKPDFVSTLNDQDKIFIRFSATVNENAVIQTAADKQNNTSRLDYSNQHSEDTVYEQLYKIQLDKVQNEAANYADLYGARFELYRGSKADANKVWFKKGTADGSIPVLDVVGVGATAPVDGAFSDIRLTDTSKDSDTNCLNSTKVIFKGLDHTAYVLHETEAPQGYNIAADTNISADSLVTLNGTITDNAGKIATSSENPDEGVVSVINETGTELPSTGGIGTTIFYVGGGLLVLLAVVLLVTKRRMNAND